MITRAFDLFFAPFAHLDPWVGMAAISLLSGVVLLVVFRFTSHQRALRATKDRLFSHLLEVVLYRDEMPVVVRAQGRLIFDNLRYLSYTLVPLACMLLPAAMLLLQIDLRYGHRPLPVGTPAVLSAQFRIDQGPDVLDRVRLAVPPEVRVETPALRLYREREVDWRLSAARPGRYQVALFVGERSLGAKTLLVGPPGEAVTPTKVRAGLLAQFLHPGEPPWPPASGLQWVHLSYPARALPLGPWRLSWIWPWLVLSMVFGYLLRGPLRVQI